MRLESRHPYAVERTIQSGARALKQPNKKSGKALRTLYPKQGYCLSLVPIGLGEMTEAELLMPPCTDYTQTLFKETTTSHSGKSLAFEVKNEKILHNIKSLIAIRVKNKGVSIP